MNQMADIEKAEWIVEGIPRSNLHHVWDDAWPYLKRAIDQFPDVEKPFTEDELLADIILGKRQLWMGWSIAEDKLVGALITDISTDANYPDCKFMSIPLLGADHWMKWGDTLWNVLKSWGAQQGCTHALGYGRKGWTRLYGFTQVGKTSDGIPIFMRKLSGLH